MTFDSALHPRGHASNAGSFADKPQTAPEVTLRERLPSEAVGYSFNADNYTPDGLIAHLVGQRSPLGALTKELAAEQPDASVGELLFDVAAHLDVNLDDEASYDSDDFPKPFFEDQVTIDEHPLLGREYWNFPGYDEEPLTDRDALDAFAQSLELDSNITEELWEGTNYSQPAAWNIAQLHARAAALNVDLVALGYPLPTRHNHPDDVVSDRALNEMS